MLHITTLKVTWDFKHFIQFLKSPAKSLNICSMILASMTMNDIKYINCKQFWKQGS
jgi:cytochrome c2